MNMNLFEENKGVTFGGFDLTSFTEEPDVLFSDGGFEPSGLRFSSFFEARNISSRCDLLTPFSSSLRLSQLKWTSGEIRSLALFSPLANLFLSLSAPVPYRTGPLYPLLPPDSEQKGIASHCSHRQYLDRSNFRP
jgi:hypothetical protein